MKKIIFCFAAIALLFCLCACGAEGSAKSEVTSSKDSESTIPGKYILTQVIKTNGTVMTGEEFDRDEFSMTFREDGTAVSVTEGDVAGTFQWEYENGKLYVVSNGQRESFDYKDNTITLITHRGETWVFTKQ